MLPEFCNSCEASRSAVRNVLRTSYLVLVSRCFHRWVRKFMMSFSVPSCALLTVEAWPRAREGDVRSIWQCTGIWVVGRKWFSCQRPWLSGFLWKSSAAAMQPAMLFPSSLGKMWLFRIEFFGRRMVVLKL